MFALGGVYMPVVSGGTAPACEGFPLSPSLCATLPLKAASLIIKAANHLLPLCWGKAASANLVSLGFSLPGLRFCSVFHVVSAIR